MSEEKREERPFEDVLAALEKEVARLEQGNLPLAESLTAFEHGMKLAEEADKRLSEAEERVEALVQGPDGADEIAPFEQVYPDVDLDPSGG